HVTGVQTCALPISPRTGSPAPRAASTSGGRRSRPSRSRDARPPSAARPASPSPSRLCRSGGNACAANRRFPRERGWRQCGKSVAGSKAACADPGRIPVLAGSEADRGLRDKICRSRAGVRRPRDTRPRPKSSRGAQAHAANWTPRRSLLTLKGLDAARTTGSVMIEIQIGEGDRIEWALKQFRRKMLRSGLFKDMKKKRFYEKPSEAKKRKAADARRRTARAKRRGR